VAPRPGLEPGTYGLTVELTPISMAAKLKIRNAFFLRIRPIVSDRAYPEPRQPHETMPASSKPRATD
jgi:hypothetical protein